jgi:hypothetical protein
MASLGSVLIGVSSYPGAVVEGTIQNGRIRCDALRKHNYEHAFGPELGSGYGLSRSAVIFVVNALKPSCAKPSMCPKVKTCFETEHHECHRRCMHLQSLRLLL